MAKHSFFHLVFLVFCFTANAQPPKWFNPGIVIGEGNSIDFAHPAQNTRDGVSLVRQPGGAMNFNYKSLFFFKSLDNNAFQIRSSGNTPFVSLLPFGNSFITSKSLVVGKTVFPNESTFGKLQVAPDNEAVGIAILQGPNLVRRMELRHEAIQVIDLTTQNALMINPDGGNVGIGTTTNTFGYRLAVNGTIGAKEIVVEVNNNWPDYIFADAYDLKPLEEVKEHINDYQHLPDIPSAEDVAKDGVSLGEMNRLLLEKVEQLTLYLINQNERIKELETSN